MKIRPPAGLIHAVAAGLMGSLRYHHFGVANLRAARRLSPTGAGVFCLWHQSLIPIIGPHGGMKIAALASLSGDGAIIADILTRMGYRTVRGSSARGGARAAKELMSAIEDGWLLAITCDGPRGPYKQPKSGPVELARRFGLPLVPVAARATRELTFKRSWDRFRVPLPLSHVAVVYGEPVVFPTDEPDPAEIERRRVELGRRLDVLEARASALAGRSDRWPKDVAR
jgi:lysophospholipid acyltransferase (LPLAT)-like uncharacterized protein